LDSYSLIITVPGGGGGVLWVLGKLLIQLFSDLKCTVVGTPGGGVSLAQNSFERGTLGFGQTL
jgi:hypothetical protein